ncbi:MAG: hypothetical protein GY928_03640 [Colwellia sp.]|nr:hypothetical protein [Colwellia sp.]
MADKGYDGDLYRQFIESEGVVSVIPKRKIMLKKKKKKIPDHPHYSAITG